MLLLSPCCVTCPWGVWMFIATAKKKKGKWYMAFKKGYYINRLHGNRAHIYCTFSDPLRKLGHEIQNYIWLNNSKSKKRKAWWRVMNFRADGRSENTLLFILFMSFEWRFMKINLQLSPLRRLWPFSNEPVKAFSLFRFLLEQVFWGTPDPIQIIQVKGRNLSV